MIRVRTLLTILVLLAPPSFLFPLLFPVLPPQQKKNLCVLRPCSLQHPACAWGSQDEAWRRGVLSSSVVDCCGCIGCVQKLDNRYCNCRRRHRVAREENGGGRNSWWSGDELGRVGTVPTVCP